jgi:amino acid transporter
MVEVFDFILMGAVIGIFAYTMFGGFSSHTSEEDKAQLRKYIFIGFLILAALTPFLYGLEGGCIGEDCLTR